MSDDDLGTDFFVRLRSDLLVIGDSILTDRHHASGGDVLSVFFVDSGYVRRL